MKIVTFSPEYLEALRTLYLESRTAAFTWLNTTHYLLTDFDADTEGEAIYVAIENDKVLGFISVWEPDYFIHHLYVSTGYQKIGIGSRLLDFVKSKYPHELGLKCLTNNDKATAFYESRGFIKKKRSSDPIAGDYYLMILPVNH
ncbi:GNAT family N-acetyltransferase [Xenorhabdus szentirmaii]|uniref:N-acetyltransferase domain-containing protein n=2 Tax=Xenorhabdus szentirmaii TaxID=290112 RepID=W1IRV0_9GAMM|nr:MULTISPECIES: GNAT family N-acetyltransferase [Xenorhabdus]MBD2781404.1 GNAT family N-acetyltransferase [Xenorhabdus sp. 38]MBD2791523.1 GNAT family N-acetyltransferase [Xenorhabdus sp. CUL]MBD2800528.1 GNAT family N-acetyltransferase [Xenorhabdus sp. M]MBD2805272.1 GNAT family N-acetyltransferase [Xenorhabdus sp. ZM]MBD2821794.1 GNAT family N-acetyltransferase [Xenorhabdus sp. 42]